MKAKLTRLILAILLCGFVLLGSAGCPGKARKRHSAPEMDSRASSPSQETSAVGVQGTFKNYTLVVPAQGPRVWSAEVASGHADSTTGMLVLTEVRCTMYEKGKETIHVTADTAKASIEGNVVRATLSGNVKAVSVTRKQQVSASTLRWSSTEQKIHAEQFHWIGEGLTVQADHGVFSSDLTRADFHGNVRMETASGVLRR